MNLGRFLGRLGTLAGTALSLSCLFTAYAQQNGSKVRFEVSFPGSVRNEPITGRMFVAISPTPDPEPRIAFQYTGSALEEVQSGELAVPGTPIRVVLAEMFAELDR